MYAIAMRAHAREMTKLAYAEKGCSSPPSYEEQRLMRFKGTPFFAQAERLMAVEAQRRVRSAQRDIERQRQDIARQQGYLEDAIMSLHWTQLDAALAEWKYEKDQGKSAGKTKVAERIQGEVNSTHSTSALEEELGHVKRQAAGTNKVRKDGLNARQTGMIVGGGIGGVDMAINYARTKKIQNAYARHGAHVPLPHGKIAAIAAAEAAGFGGLTYLLARHGLKRRERRIEDLLAERKQK